MANSTVNKTDGQSLSGAEVMDIVNATNSKQDAENGKGLSEVNFSTAKDAKLNGIAAGATANDTDVNLKARANHTGTQSADTITDGTTNKAFLATEKTKLSGIATGATANDTDANLKNRANHTGTQSADTLIDGTTNKAFLATEKTKLSGIATGATANDTDANLKARANHTGTQTASTISDFTAAVQALLATPAPVVETYTTGTTLALANATTRLIVNPATTASTLTVTLPATPTNGQHVRIYVGGTVTSGTVVTTMTVTASQGIIQAPVFTPTDGQYGDTYTYEYLSSTSKWYLL